MGFSTTDRANEDIYAIYLFGLEQFGFAQAERYGDELFNVFEILARQPHSARERKEYEPAYRVHIHGVHAIFYLIEGDDILIVRVLHASQDWRRHL